MPTLKERPQGHGEKYTFFSWKAEKLLEKLAPFEEFSMSGKKQARPGGGIMKNCRTKVSRKLYNLDQSCFEQRISLQFMFAQIQDCYI